MTGARRARPDIEPLLVDMEGAGRALGGIGRNVIRALIVEKRLDEVSIGRLRLITVASIRRVSEELCEPAAPPPAAPRFTATLAPPPAGIKRAVGRPRKHPPQEPRAEA